MRRSGVCASVSGLGRHDHVCVPYADDAALADAVADYLSDGRRLGQRLMYVGASPEEKLRADLADFPDAERLFADGVLQVASLASIYELGRPVDAGAQLRTYAQATEGALKEGFTGLRVAAEVTELVAAPETWDAHVQWETIADGYMAHAPLSAMCCYDRRALPKSILADLARVHPAVCRDDGLAPFRIFAGDDRNTLMLDGEVDYFSAEDLDRLLALAMPEGSRTVIDLGALEFVEQHGLRRIVARASDPGGGPPRVRNLPEPARRLCELMELDV